MKNAPNNNDYTLMEDEEFEEISDEDFNLLDDNYIGLEDDLDVRDFIN
jgi:hypothetical protein